MTEFIMTTLAILMLIGFVVWVIVQGFKAAWEEEADKQHKEMEKQLAEMFQELKFYREQWQLEHGKKKEDK